MSTVPENKLAPDLSGALLIKLDKFEFPVPTLAWKQNRIVEPLVQKVLPTYYEFLNFGQEQQRLAKEAKDVGQQPDASGFMQVLSQFRLQEDALDDLATIVYTGITRGTPGFSRAEFDEIQFGIPELFEAMSVVMAQTGLFRRRVQVAGDAPQGEAAADTSQSIGIES